MRTFRMVHVGVAAAMAAAGVASIGLVQSAGAAGSATVSSFVPIVPCRLVDTRPLPDNVGSRNTPIGSGETVQLQVTGTNGNCTIPAGATAIATNVTAATSTAAGFVTLFPSDATKPTASNLNVVPNGAPTPNQVTVALSATGAVSVFNLSGNVNLIIDIVGYYTPATSGAGTKGDKGDKGDTGGTGPAGPTCPTTGCVAYFTGSEAQPNFAIASPYGIEPASGCLHINPASASNFAVLDFALPAGATITAVTVLFRNGNAAATTWPTVQLFKNGGLAGSVVDASDATKTILNSDQVGLNLKDAAKTPVSRSAQYFITDGKITNNLGDAQSLCGAEVTYTMP